MHSSSQPRGRRRATSAVVAFALGSAAVVSGVVGASPAQADTTVTEGSLNWGFKQTFRTYVGNQTAALPPIGALPVGQRIVPAAPAAFAPPGTGPGGSAASTAEETRPYGFPASSGSVTSATSVDLPTTGGVVYHFPSHGFEITLSDLRLAVNGSTATIYADTIYNSTNGDFGFPVGVFTGENVPIATTSTVSVNVAANGASVTISGTDVTLTAEGAEYVPLYTEGTAIDDFTATATLQDPVGPTQPNGTVTLSKTSVDPEGDTVTVTGSGFSPNDDIVGTRPPLSGQQAGVYVAFGRFDDVWKPSDGAASATRPTGSTASGAVKWAVLEGNMAAIGGPASGAIELNSDGTFTATLTVSEAYRNPVPTTGNWGIYTYAGSGAVESGYETFTPITFAEPLGEDQQSIVATVPQPSPGGEFLWTIDATDRTVDLGTMVNHGSYYQASGSLKPVLVTDTRTNQANAWSISGQLSDFDNGLSGNHLGWTPQVTSAGAGAVAGASVDSGLVGGGPGLSVSSVLGSAVDGHASGTGTLGADLDLRFPVETAAGTYTALLTLTALS